MGGSRISPAPIVVDHIRAIRGSDGTVSPWDIGRQFLVPIVLGAAAMWAHLALPGEVAAALLAASGLIAAFTFQLTIVINEQVLALSAADVQPGPDLSRRCTAMRYLSANAAYASLIALATAASATAAAIFEKGIPDQVATAVTTALSLHLLMVMLLVLRRVFVSSSKLLTQIAAGGRTKQDV